MAGRLYGGMMERVADEVTWMPTWMSMAYMCLLPEMNIVMHWHQFE